MLCPCDSYAPALSTEGGEGVASCSFVVDCPKHHARSAHRRRRAHIPPSSWPRVTQTFSLSPQRPQHRDTSPCLWHPSDSLARPAQLSHTVCLSSLTSASHFLVTGTTGSDISRVSCRSSSRGATRVHAFHVSHNARSHAPLFLRPLFCIPSLTLAHVPCTGSLRLPTFHAIYTLP